MANTFIPKKYLGQNFLIDKTIQERIVNSCNLSDKDIVLEIGPGMGAITDLIALKVKKVIAIEKDTYLAKKLKYKYEGGNVEVICYDILKYPFSKLPNRVKIISNLPYNVATPIIEKVIKNKEHFSDFYMTVQFEYGLRITAMHNTKPYGAFSCFIQYYCNSRLLFNIRNTAFRPIPKVKSCFLHLDMNKSPSLKAKDEKLLFRVIRQAFNQRRKRISNSLSSIVPNKEILIEILNKSGLSPEMRAENISLEKYVYLSDEIHKINVKK